MSFQPPQEPSTKRRKKHKKKALKAALGNHYVPKKQQRKRLSTTDIRDLIVRLDAARSPPNFIASWHIPRETQVAVCVIPGLEDAIPFDTAVDDVSVPLSSSMLAWCPLLQDLQGLSCVFRFKSPGLREEFFLFNSALLTRPITTEEKRQRETEGKELARKMSIEDYLLTPKRMLALGYPSSCDADHKVTQNLKFPLVRVFGMDCEFCESRGEKVLTQICLLNQDGSVVVSKLVKPDKEITDYKTEYSGITAERLEGVTTTLAEVQDELLQIVSSNDILVGHSLESDLKVLRLCHQRIFDTAAAFDHVQGPPKRPSLKWLAEKYLNRVIQRSENGHDPEEDARAALDLMKSKLEAGPYYGKLAPDVSLLSVQTSVLHGDDIVVDPETFEEDVVRVREAAQKVAKERFLMLTIRGLECDLCLKAERAKLASALVDNLVKELPAETAVILISPTTGKRAVDEQMRRRREAREAFLPWEKHQQANLQQLIKEARQGYFLFGFKKGK